MRVRAVTLALLAAAAAACTTAPPAARRSPAPIPEPASAPARSPRDQTREAIDGWLESAQDAVATGAVADFHDCESAVLQALPSCDCQVDQDPRCGEYVGHVLDELDRMAEQLQPASGELEPPPEPQPVPAERVAQEQAKAETETFDLPVVVNPEVTSLIEFYTGPYRDRFETALERASHLLPFIRAELRKAKAPEDLAYLPLVESAFNPVARSRARAQGLWQFMAGTARLYHLRCDGLVDERNDPYLATPAAISMLSELKATFGSWELALAAYNSGPGRVERALRRAHGETDFWTLRRYLPRQTRNYGPALWAALVVAKNPSAYGFPKLEEHVDCQARLEVSGALDIEVLAEKASLDADALAELNPALLRRITPSTGSYRLAIPCGSEQVVAAALAAIPPDQRVRRLFHVVRRGDTLAAIARRYGTTAETIASANRIRNVRALHIGQTLEIPRYPAVSRRTARPVRVAQAEPPPRHKRAGDPPKSGAPPERYVVRHGDTLYSIAHRFRTSVELLQRRNGLDGTRIQPGDVLLMP